MQNLYNINKSVWKKPWMVESFDDLANRDERFFSILLKGVLSWLTRNIVLYNKPIKHFIFNTGSSYLYMENIGYEFSWSETSGEDQIYMKMPRCIVELEGINIPSEELTNPFIRGTYERKDEDKIAGFNAEIRRLPIELNLNLKYVLSNMNESLVLLQELLDKILFQRFFNIVYLGQTIQCSLELPTDYNVEINKIDMSSPEVNQKNIAINIKVCSNYPIINDRTEISNDKVIGEFDGSLNIIQNETITDTEKITVK